MQTSSVSGQSLIEILIGIVVGVIMIGAAVVAIVLTLRVNQQSQAQQAASFLAQELTNNAAAYAEGDWHGFYDLNDPPMQYHLVVSGSALATSSGSEIIAMDNVNYTRYFTAENVVRDGAGKIAAAGTDDPSTQKITVTVEWTQAGDLTNVTTVSYVARNRNLVIQQSDWSGGPGQLGPITVVNNKFDTQTDLDYTGEPGTIKISGF